MKHFATNKDNGRLKEKHLCDYLSLSWTICVVHGALTTFTWKNDET